jgi:hypothetical protein
MVERYGHHKPDSTFTEACECRAARSIVRFARGTRRPPAIPAITAFKFDQKPFATFVVQIFVVKVRDF